MLSTFISVDREVVEHSFREWQEEQSLLDAQLAESVAALDAYQAHLDNWQQELASERDELRQLRETIGHDQSSAGMDGNGKVEQLNKELDESHEKIASLTTALLARTEELRDLDHQREGTNTELTRAREREKELAAALAAQQASEAQRHHGEKQPNHQRESNDKAADHSAAGNHGDSVRNGAAKVEPRRGASPVLGSVMEQFGKLREQRSLNRSNNKPR